MYINSCHALRLFEDLQSLRKEEVLCDIRLETDDGKIVFGHTIVLVSASPYFRALFTNFFESTKDVVNIKELDYKILLPLMDYIYIGKMITTLNVQGLLAASNLFQLDYVKGVCVEFLQMQLNPTNYLGINALADIYYCTDLLLSSEAYIKKEFWKVVEGDEFLSLSSEEVIKLISSSDINVPFEEKVFAFVIKWVKHDLDCRHDCLPKLMEHVRLPLISIEDISKKVANEPLLKNSLECNDFVNEILHFSTIKTKPRIHTIHYVSTLSRKKVILISSYSLKMKNYYLTCYDPVTKLLENIPEITNSSISNTLVLIKQHLVFSFTNKNVSVKMLDLSSQRPCWVSKVNTKVNRKYFGVCVVKDKIYAVGGCNINYYDCAEVYNDTTQKWIFISHMSTKRSYLSVGVINNLLYAAVGYNSHSSHLKYVECYDLSFDKWTPIAEMSVKRTHPGVGTLNDIMYAVGSYNSTGFLNSVEAYSPNTGVWSSIPNMHLSRMYPSVIALNGLLYVIGGCGE